MLKQSQAFTLMEIMLVVIIIGVIATVAMPSYQLALERTHSAEGVQMLGSLHDAIKIFYFEQESLPTSMGNLQITFSGIQYFSDPVLPGTKDSIAEVTRVGGVTSYDLGISLEGDIYCDSTPLSYCSRLGY
jgi:prepilin-type N-terminal cleavage/methylation domain-containing protein